jgi:hypothetical protein
MSYEAVQLLHQTVRIEVTAGLIKAIPTSIQEQVRSPSEQWNTISCDTERWHNVTNL